MFVESPSVNHAKPRGARAILRDATAAVHERLHGARFFDALSAGRLGWDGYAELLARIHAFHDMTLASLRRARGVLDLPQAGVEQRLALIEADLRHLGRPVATLSNGWTPPGGDAGAVGCLYVVEGSTLGGKLIHRQLDFLFGEGAAGRTFFCGASDDGARWRRLCEAIDLFGTLPNHLQPMTMGAEACFALFESCLSEEAPCSRT